MAFISSLALSRSPHTRTSLTRRRPRPKSISIPIPRRRPCISCLRSDQCLDSLEPHEAISISASNTIPNSQIPPKRTFNPLKFLYKRPLIALILVCIPLLYPFLPSITSITQLIQAVTASISSLPRPRASIILGITNFFTVLLCFPANMGLMIAAGALLGPRYAFCALFISKILAASVAFALARRVFVSYAQKWLSRHPRLDRVLKESGQQGGWKFVVLMRLGPFPGFMLNYMLSLTGVPFKEYLFGTVLGVFPSVLNLVLVGAAAREVGMEVSGAGTGWLGLALKFVCIASMFVATVFVSRKTNQILKEANAEMK